MKDPRLARSLADLAARHGLSEECLREIAEILEPGVADSALPTMYTIQEGPARPRPPLVRGYESSELLGVGGMGEVWRVYDPSLNRYLALKSLRSHLTSDPVLEARFLGEARLTAQLQHPGIVPVHTTGELSDGRRYFTMKEVSGRNLREIIREIHFGSTAAQWVTTSDGWNLNRVMVAFYQVCQTVAYAHQRGVLHRDLKPSNVMIGEFGEVYVMDWGLARVDGSVEQSPTRRHEEEDATLTVWGEVPGTPAYMSPEQIVGDIDAIGPASDVYALGAMLYEILSGQPPYGRGRPEEVIRMSRAGPPPPPDQCGSDRPGPPIPEDLADICMQALSREPRARFPDAAALAREISAWLDGARRLEQARALVITADVLLAGAASRREQAITLRAEAQAILAAVQPHESVEWKLPGWEKEDAAEALDQAAERDELEYVQTLRAALYQAPDFADAHERLARHYAEAHRQSEARQDSRHSQRLELLLRAHDRGTFRSYLQGDGSISLVTDPPGATVRLYRYERWQRRLVATFLSELGTTPLVDVSLARGSYLLTLQAPGCAQVRYPVLIGREEAWDGVRPGEVAPHPIPLPAEDALGEDDIYIPAGWFRSGGDSIAAASLPRRRLWCRGFVMRRYPVTNAEYMVFLNELLSWGREEEALRWAPRERAGAAGTPGALIYGRDDSGRFILVPDADGDRWEPGWPVLKVGFDGATAYARWQSARTGLPWRLPGELEWEKAARGVDGRYYPWGDFLDPTFCCMQDSHPPQRRLPAVVTAFPLDVSPYGVRGMGGNARDWCLDSWCLEGSRVSDGAYAPPPNSDGEADRRVCRGGAWWQRAEHARVASRVGVRETLRDVGVSFRLVRSV